MSYVESGTIHTVNLLKILSLRMLVALQLLPHVRIHLSCNQVVLIVKGEGSRILFRIVCLDL